MLLVISIDHDSMMKDLCWKRSDNTAHLDSCNGARGGNDSYSTGHAPHIHTTSKPFAQITIRVSSASLTLH